MDLKEKWRELCIAYSSDTVLIDKRWKELKDAYSNKKRHYHCLEHLEIMFREFDASFHLLTDEFKPFQFAIFYHDIIYNVKRKDNEEKSAELAIKQLTEFSVPQNIIDKTHDYIIATKSHEMNALEDVNLFIDVDVAILGYDWEIYNAYAQNVRKEYSVFPDFMYKKGRRAVLEHFLEMKSIYKTEMYQRKYETKARENIQKEIELL